MRVDVELGDELVEVVETRLEEEGEDRMFTGVEVKLLESVSVVAVVALESADTSDVGEGDGSKYKQNHKHC